MLKYQILIKTTPTFLTRYALARYKSSYDKSGIAVEHKPMDSIVCVARRLFTLFLNDSMLHEIKL
jgi:hypothetical protein